MKKFIIGLGVLVVFGIYSLGIRHQNPVIGKPVSLAGSGSNSRAGTTSSSGSGTPPAGSGSGTTSANVSYKDGTYTGSVANAYYGNVQVKATISGGKITSVNFLQFPNTHETSVIINQQAIPYLQQEAIQSQGANVQIVSGATFTSQAFQQSLQSALQRAS
jgi:uncharacterized protein with FMN-binding domain